MTHLRLQTLGQYGRKHCFSYSYVHMETYMILCDLNLK